MKEKLNKIDKLKFWIKEIGLKPKYFAEQYYISEYIEPNEADINKFYEKFRGHLKRNTTSDEIIDLYLNFLFDMDEFKNTTNIKANFYSEEAFSKEFNKKMKNISMKITNDLVINEDSK